MAAALQCFAFFGGHPNPSWSSGMHRPAEAGGLSRLSTSSCAFLCQPLRMRSSATVPGLSPSALPFIRRRCLQNLHPSLHRRFPGLVTFASPQEDSKSSNIEVESIKNELGIKTNESLKAWKQMLESFKVEAIRMQSISQEAYEVYSKRAMIVLEETSQKMKVQADQARRDFAKLAKEIVGEGKEYLSTAAKNSPESMKDILETFAASTDDLKGVSDVRDFYLGIPYGGLLAIGGFVNFMLTESISAVRFGIIPGCALLALSISSLRAWRSGQSSAASLKGQAAIAAIIFIRQWNLLSQRLSFLSLFVTLISGAMLVLYLYRLIIDGQGNGPSLEQTPEK